MNEKSENVKKKVKKAEKMVDGEKIEKDVVKSQINPVPEDGKQFFEEKMFNEKYEDENGVRTLVAPNALPANGRVACMVFGRKPEKTKAGLIVPVSATGTIQNPREHNPWLANDFVIVAYTEDARQNCELPLINKEPIKTGKTISRHPDGQPKYKTIKRSLGIGDIAVVGAEFIPVLRIENGVTYAYIHYMDIVAVVENQVKYYVLHEEKNNAENDEKEKEE